MRKYFYTASVLQKKKHHNLKPSFCSLVTVSISKALFEEDNSAYAFRILLPLKAYQQLLKRLFAEPSPAAPLVVMSTSPELPEGSQWLSRCGTGVMLEVERVLDV